MKFEGDLNMNQNQLQNIALEEVTEFPVDPALGEVCFKNMIVYICTQITLGVPTWIPLTNELKAFIHTQPTPSSQWVIDHNLGKEVIVQIVDAANEVLIPNAIIQTSVNRTTIDFLNTQIGRAIIVAASSGGGIHTVTAHMHEQTIADTTWLVTHDLGYKPLVQVVLSDGYQMVPLGVQHVTDATSIITFSQPQTGSARLI